MTTRSIFRYAFALDIVNQPPHEAVLSYVDGLIKEKIVLSAAR